MRKLGRFECVFLAAVFLCVAGCGGQGGGGDGGGTAAKTKKPPAPSNELAAIEQEAYEYGWKEGAGEGRKWAENIRQETARGNPRAMINSVQENAGFYLQQRDTAIRSIQDFERERGEPCEIPQYYSNRGNTRGKYEGFMSEVGTYLD